MKTNYLFFVFLVTGLTIVNFSAYQAKGQTSKNSLVEQPTVSYMCSMHSEVVMDHPGNCPMCGMKLTKLKDGPKAEVKPACDSASMKKDYKKMMCDSTLMKEEHMMHDSTCMKHVQSVK